jgi:hypothetical protein
MEKNYLAMFNEAKAIRDIDRMAVIFEELAAEAGIMDDAAKGKRLATLMNSKMSGRSFEGSVPGKKI